MDAAQELDQLSSFLSGKPGKGFAADLVREIENTGEDRPGLIGQDEAAGAAVARLRLPLDPSVLLHAVDLPHQGHRLDFEQIGEACLVNPFVAGEITQHLALRPGKTEKEQGALIKTPPEQAGDVMNKKAEAAVEIHAYRSHSDNK